MRRFCLGDNVRVANLAASQWQNRVGTIVEIFEHGPYEEGKIVQECAVDLDGERRWFMDKHLMRTVPAKLIRFFRTEVSQRWQLDPNDVGLLNGDREQLVDLLRDRFSFVIRRAEAEVDDFYITFKDRISRATDRCSPPDISPFEKSA